MKKDNKDSLPIIIIMIMSAILYSVNVGDVVNQYYAAGVYSMGQNFHAFFFNSLDSVGFVTIDKPPLGFWIQTLFTKVFGYGGFVLILPEIICGVLSVYLIYRIIDKRFNRESALIAASILALTPIFTAVVRNNTIDSILILFMLLASQQALIAAEKSKLRHLVYAGVLIGIGFNIKMLQAYMVVPAIFLLYLIFSKEKFFKRILACGLSVIVMLAVSLSWVATVDLIDEDKRPYVGSSQNNSAIELAIGYNGLNRIIGGGGKSNKTDNVNASNDNIRPQMDNRQDDGARAGNTPQNGMQTDRKPPRPDADMQVNRPALNDANDRQIQQGNNASNVSAKKDGGGEAGQASIFRLYNSNNAGQIAWFVVPGALSLVGLVWLIIKKKTQDRSKNIAFVFFVLCFISMFIYFSFSSGLAHRYYFATMAPFIAGLVGCGYYYLKYAKRWIIVLIFVASAAVQMYIQSLYCEWLFILIPICSVVFLAAIVIMAISQMFNMSSEAMSKFMIVLLILPAVWSISPVVHGDNSQLPIAGPELAESRNSFANTTDYSELVSYLEQNRDGAQYQIAVPSSMGVGSQLIIQSDGSVMALGGFNGNHSTVTLEEFIQMVKNNKVNYAIIENNSKNNVNKQIFDWIRSNCKVEKTFNNIRIYRLDK